MSLQSPARDDTTEEDVTSVVPSGTQHDNRRHPSTEVLGYSRMSLWDISPPSYPRSLDFPVTSQGETFAAAKANLQEAVELYIETWGADDQPEHRRARTGQTRSGGMSRLPDASSAALVKARSASLTGHKKLQSALRFRGRSCKTGRHAVRTFGIPAFPTEIQTNTNHLDTWTASTPIF